MIFDSEIKIVFAGEAGQGIETAGKILSEILHLKNFHTFFMPEYMSRVKGGCNSSLVKVSDVARPFYSEEIDVLFALNKIANEHLGSRISDETVFFNEIGGNFFTVGFVLGLFKFDFSEISNLMEENYKKILDKKDNREQFELGFKQGFINGTIEIKINTDEKIKKTNLELQNNALAKGLIAGGCNFLAFYPMSPSTALATYLCETKGIYNEQVEDEICAINMALGAYYAGARAIVTTSGGGFALMCEGVSLAGMIESPIVINIAGRPAPATGLPTRDGQEDLNLALYGGHGEFPRIIFSPSTLENSFKIGKIAFEVSEKFQVPVFILTQQGFLDSEFSAPKFEAGENGKTYVAKSDKNYKRYGLNFGAISPRAIPNYGEGFVCVDSDEHDELGQITESAVVRKTMMNKRMGKLELIKKEILEPDFFGALDFENLIISWGGNFNVLSAAISNRENFALVHPVQLYPVSNKILEYAKQAKKLILVEQNFSGQFGKLLKKELGLSFDNDFLKYDGVPISFEEITRFLDEL